MIFGTVLLQMRQHDRALLEMDRAIALSPNYAECHALRGLVLGFMGETEAAVAAIETALRLNPRAPGYYHLMAGRAHLARRDFAAALAPLQRAVGLAPAMTQIHVSLAVALDGLGRRGGAEAEVAEVRRLNPTVGVAQIAKVLLYQDETVLDDQLTRLAALGLPE